MSFLQRVLSKIGVGPTSEELGNETSVYPDADVPDDRRASVFTTEVANDVAETSEKLKEFRLLVGITTHRSFKSPRGYNDRSKPVVTTRGRPAPNRGIYTEVVTNELKSKQNYRFFSRLIASALGLQLIVAAALTAVGAANGSYRVVTVLGAINTVIAGFLTYLKGSGLPNRIKYYQHEWLKIREYIEQRERDFSVERNDLDVMDEVATIRSMFEEVRADIEMNTPDRFVGTSAFRNRQNDTAAPSLAGHRRRTSSTMSIDPLRHLREKAAQVQTKVESVEKDFETAGEAAVEGVKGFGAHVVDDLARLRGAMQVKLREVAELERQVVARGRGVREGVEDRVREVEELEKGMAELGDLGRKGGGYGG